MWLNPEEGKLRSEIPVRQLQLGRHKLQISQPKTATFWGILGFHL